MKKWIATLLVSLCLVSAGALAQAPQAPSGLLVTPQGDLLMVDSYQNGLWQKKGDDWVRLAGTPGPADIDGTPLGGYRDGAGDQALFSSPWAIAPFGDGYAITDTENHVVRLYSSQGVKTLAGTGVAGLQNGSGAKAQFNRPTGLAQAPNGGLYVADSGNHVIRHIDAKGQVSTFAGGSQGNALGATPQFSEPMGLFAQGETLLVADAGNHRIVALNRGSASLVAGSGVEGEKDGPTAKAQFSSPQGICADDRAIYVADTGNGSLRKIYNGSVSTLCQSSSLYGGLLPISPRGLTLYQGKLLVGDVFAKQVFPLEVSSLFYTDVPVQEIFAPAVEQLSARGLMAGTGNNTFSPQEPLTRGMLSTVLLRLHRASFPEEAPVTAPRPGDVSADSYYADAASWAVAANLLQAPNGQFAPHATLGLADTLSILEAYSQLVQRSSVTEQLHLSDFPTTGPLNRGQAAQLLLEYLQCNEF